MIERIRDFVVEQLPDSRILFDEYMRDYTTFKIGGKADMLFIPADIASLQKFMMFIRPLQLPVTVLGRGSNMLVSDKGIRGVVILLADNLNKICADGEYLSAEAGVSMKNAAYFAAEQALAGLEFAVGIPGNIGGGTFMNAGAYDGDFASVVEQVYSVDGQGILKQYSRQESCFAYRHSIFQDNSEIIVKTVFKLKPADTTQLQERIAELTAQRECKQPLEMPSAGSVFKRPVGYFAGTLIDQAGLKGCVQGGAQVSLKHAGFIVNKGGATAQDVLDLVAHVQQVVKAKFGVELESEIRFIGER